jgi:hypothetical protein
MLDISDVSSRHVSGCSPGDGCILSDSVLDARELDSDITAINMSCITQRQTLFMIYTTYQIPLPVVTVIIQTENAPSESSHSRINSSTSISAPHRNVSDLKGRGMHARDNRDSHMTLSFKDEDSNGSCCVETLPARTRFQSERRWSFINDVLTRKRFHSTTAKCFVQQHE